MYMIDGIEGLFNVIIRWVEVYSMVSVCILLL